MLMIILKMRLLNQLIMCVFLEHKLYLRAHEHLPNALPSLHNRYRVSQLPPSALFWDRSYIVLHLRSRIHPKPMIRSSLITFSPVTHFFTTLSTFLAQRLISRRQKNLKCHRTKALVYKGKIQDGEQLRSTNQNTYLNSRYLQFLAFFTSTAGRHEEKLWSEFRIAMFCGECEQKWPITTPGRVSELQFLFFSKKWRT